MTILVVPGRADAATKRSSRRAETARKLNALRATDKQLVGAVGALTTQVNSQINRVTAAKKAAAAAQATLDKANSALADTQRQIDQLHGAVVAHAVDTYMRPASQRPEFTSNDIAEASRQRALLAHVENREGDVLDELRAARQDLAIKQQVAERAHDKAADRKRDESAQLDGLARDLKDKQRLSSALQARIREAQSEDDAAAANEGTFGSLLGSGYDPSVISRAGLIWPLRGTITSGFGMRWGRLHAGIDIADPRGTPIHAAKSGKVVFSGWMGGYGNAIIIDHGGGLATLYGHQSRRAVSVGTMVKQGQTIGYVGSTGHSTGNHLHFETRIGGKAQNPRRFLP
jgi:murein DD-endopeptidase MepM/ murein hydrolase activator NlpD